METAKTWIQRQRQREKREKDKKDKDKKDKDKKDKDKKDKDKKERNEIGMIQKEKEEAKNEKFLKAPVIISMDPEDEMEKETDEEKEEICWGWLDIKSVLRENGVLFLTEKITKKSGKNIISLLIHLAIDNPTRDVFVFLNCVAGSGRTAIAIFDAMQSLPSDINTIGYGMTAGVGSFLLLSGDLRIGYPHLRVMMHKPKYKIFHYNKATMKNHLEKLNECQRIDNAIHEIFVARTGQPYDIIEKDMRDKLCMSAKEAQDYGIIDHITSDYHLDFDFDFDFRYPDDNPDGDSSGALYDE